MSRIEYNNEKGMKISKLDLPPKKLIRKYPFLSSIEDNVFYQFRLFRESRGIKCPELKSSFFSIWIFLLIFVPHLFIMLIVILFVIYFLKNLLSGKSKMGKIPKGLFFIDKHELTDIYLTNIDQMDIVLAMLAYKITLRNYIIFTAIITLFFITVGIIFVSMFWVGSQIDEVKVTPYFLYYILLTIIFIINFDHIFLRYNLSNLSSNIGILYNKFKYGKKYFIMDKKMLFIIILLFIVLFFTIFSPLSEIAFYLYSIFLIFFASLLPVLLIIARFTETAFVMLENLSDKINIVIKSVIDEVD